MKNYGSRLQYVLVILVIVFFLFGTFALANKNSPTGAKKTDFIKWVDFSVSEQALSDAYLKCKEAKKEEREISFSDCLAYLGARYGGDFKKYKRSDLDNLCERLKTEKIEEITKDMKYFGYFREAYSAVLSNFVGDFEIETEENGKKETVKKYGLKVFSPVARGYSYSHYDDFGSARSYGYKRKHLGHDLMGSVGTPVIAVESGIVEALGWNRFGGWRIGIRSFDKKRYYYYAHLRKGHPFSDELYEGKTVTAGDVIGYLGMTGYSTNEDVNNINTPHLHYGLQLIFDESQKEGNNEIWIDMYALTNFLEKNKSAVIKTADGKEFTRKYQMFEEKTMD